MTQIRKTDKRRLEPLEQNQIRNRVPGLVSSGIICVNPALSNPRHPRPSLSFKIQFRVFLLRELPGEFRCRPSLPFPTPAAGSAPTAGGSSPKRSCSPLDQLDAAYREAKDDPAFQSEFTRFLNDYVGRPSRLYFAERLTKEAGGARIYLKREDLNHTGAHKINNAIGQAMLTKRMGKTRVIAETGAGMHGVATATAAALFGLPCRVYMGTEDIRRQELNVFRMRAMGTEVFPVESGSRDAAGRRSTRRCASG